MGWMREVCSLAAKGTDLRSGDRCLQKGVREISIASRFFFFGRAAVSVVQAKMVKWFCRAPLPVFPLTVCLGVFSRSPLLLLAASLLFFLVLPCSRGITSGYLVPNGRGACMISTNLLGIRLANASFGDDFTPLLLSNSVAALERLSHQRSRLEKVGTACPWNEGAWRLDQGDTWILKIRPAKMLYCHPLPRYFIYSLCASLLILFASTQSRCLAHHGFEKKRPPRMSRTSLPATAALIVY